MAIVATSRAFNTPIETLDGQRSLLAELLAEHLPEARTRPLEWTYLARLNIATSPGRLTEIVRRMAAALARASLT